jgi:hypothetical protein
MEYYIEPAEQTDEVKAQLAAITPKSLDPESLTMLDPACGSGHILVECYDLFKAIYQERGYRSKDIPRLILQKNLFGLEIDDRAAQLAGFALLMKARADDRRIFADHVQPNVIAIQESKGLENLLRPDPAAAKGFGELPFADSDLFPQTEKQLTLTKPNQESPLAAVEPCLRELINLFEHGKTFGSLIRVPTELAAQLPAARQTIEAMAAKGQLWENRAATLMFPLLRQAELLAQTYGAVVTNPPYMGSKFFNAIMKAFVEDYYGGGRNDLYACFMARNVQLTISGGFVGMITLPGWLFLTSFEDLRRMLLDQSSIVTLIDNGRGIWGSDFGSCAFVIFNRSSSTIQGSYKRLYQRPGEVNSIEGLLAAFHDDRTFPWHNVSASEFVKIAGCPIAFWLSDKFRNSFAGNQPLGKFAEPRKGMVTGDNPRFIRNWYEVSFRGVMLGATTRQEAKDSKKRWFPYQKGGEFRKWYGNMLTVVDWENDGYRLLGMKAQGYKTGSTNHNLDYIFHPAVVWTKVTIAEPSFRICSSGFLFDDASGLCVSRGDCPNEYILAFLSSRPGIEFLKTINPTVNTGPGNLAVLPVTQNAPRVAVVDIATECINIVRADWDNFETSWDFRDQPLLRSRLEGATLETSWRNWEAQSTAAVRRMQELETDNNRLFIAAYGLDGELQPEVPEELITLACADSEKDMQRLISYAIGCMMGRYSLDKRGLVYAHCGNEGFDPSQYRTFPADVDGIIPITELAWFPDDATERFIEFIGKAWPGEHLEENLKFIADSLGPNRDEHPRDTIRRYLATGFYKDHLQTYKRRPIYWLFTSGKQKAFQCLVYLHRYNEGTLARMRTEYVIPLQGKLSHRIDQLTEDAVVATSTSHRRKLEKEKESLVKQRAELAAFDEKLRHYADQRIALDLDDGVKVNYAKFGDLLAEVKAVTGGTEE